MASDDAKTSKIQAHFETLYTVSSSLNTASNELGKSIDVLDEALKKLNLGIVAWEPFRYRGDEEDPDEYDQDEIGYCKVNGTWGIALRHIWGHEGMGTHKQDGPWLFNEAPREMRISSVDKIPTLIESLGKEASDLAKKLHERTKEVRALAEIIGKMPKVMPVLSTYPEGALTKLTNPKDRK